jgi:hypothetical protein
MGHASWNAGEDAPEEEPMSNDAPEPSDDGRGKSVASFDPWLARARLCVMSQDHGLRVSTSSLMFARMAFH